MARCAAPSSALDLHCKAHTESLQRAAGRPARTSWSKAHARRLSLARAAAFAKARAARSALDPLLGDVTAQPAIAMAERTRRPVLQEQIVIMLRCQISVAPRSMANSQALCRHAAMSAPTESYRGR